jgi:glycerol-3-phosphate dehydrogenase subunit B
MRSDVVVVGAELEALLTTLRLLERGARVRLLAPGGGSLPYAPGGLQLLGSPKRPLDSLDSLSANHPLRVLGRNSIAPAIDWFLKTMERLGSPWIRGSQNIELPTTVGGPRYAVARPKSQASLEALRGHRIGVASFASFRDFPAELVSARLRRQDLDATVFHIELGQDAADSMKVGQAFDRPGHAQVLYGAIQKALPVDRDIVLSPAVFGIHRHTEVIDELERAIGRPVLEAPTLPPSLFGVRLHHVLMREIMRLGGIVQHGMSQLRGQVVASRCEAILDREGYAYTAGHYVAGTGGVMMGGLEVDSTGYVSEPLFDLAVHQTNPLAQTSPAATIDALHRAGIETDALLRPVTRNGIRIENIRATGGLLAHWNPTVDGSAEGVSIGTGWAAAEDVADGVTA